ncbi:MAG: efflux RND transporter periplasmic adaptor subunit [Phycisphaeraceae bacterium]|nr:efflux RND transporter periplasmic adaptor subunit [Phycisphaeraceae bacterium]
MSIIKRAPGLVLRGLPTVLTIAVLAGVGYMGHRTGWKIPAASEVFGGGKESREDWCGEHGVPESTCMICRGLKANSVPPSQQRKGGVATTAAPEPEVEQVGTKKRPAVQLATGEIAARAGIEVQPAAVKPVDETVEANAEVSFDLSRYAQVAPRLPGTVALMRVQPGQRVKRGDVLALVDAVEVGRVKAELLQAAAQIVSRQRALDRIRSSTEAGFRNQADVATAEAELKEASIRLFNARQSLVNLGLPTPATAEGEIPDEHDVLHLGLPEPVLAELDPSRASGNLLPVLSPIDGVVISRAAVAGEVVESGKPLLAVSDTSRMWVHAELTPAQATMARVGQPLEFVPDVAGSTPVVGKVTWISPEVNEKTRTIQVRAEVDNSDGRLFAHSFGRARITVKSSTSAVVVPESALQKDGESHLLFVKLNDEVFQTREVRVGGQGGGWVEIVAGLRAGEPVAIKGSYALAAQLNRAKLGAGCTDD